MALHGPQSLEVGRNDADPEMSLAVARAGVTDVQVAVVDEFHRIRMQCAAQSGADSFGAGHSRTPCVHSVLGSSDGSFVASQIPCSTVNTSVRPITPNTLNLAQVSVLKLCIT